MNGKRIEEMSLNHWPALSTAVHEGWLLRYADGYTKRANSVSAIYGAEGDAEKRIEWCERRYAALGLPAVFKMTPFDRPADLDRLLADRGYEMVDPTIIQTLDLGRISRPHLDRVHITEQLTKEWVEAFCRMSGVKESHKPAMQRMLETGGVKKGFAVFLHEDQVAACGFGVVENGWIGLYDVVTDATYRNRGFATRMLETLLYWGKEQGATHSYLAVVADNAPARRLYEKLGYEELYRYWYRVKARNG